LILKKDNFGWLIRNSNLYSKTLENHCLRMTSHPTLGYIHDHNEMCEIKGGFADGPFIFYKQKKNKAKYTILTLGGSTTDGFYQKISNGDTWPYLLSKKIQNKDYQVVNGGTGGYDTSHELLKLMIDGTKIPSRIKYIISLSGINDTLNYNGLGKNSGFLPYWKDYQFKSFINKKFEIIGQNPVSKYFPSSISAIKYIKKKLAPIIKINKNNKWEKYILLSNQKKIDPLDQWEFNISILNEISKKMGAKYIYFLQPNMLINDNQIPKNTTTNDYKIYKRFINNPENIEYIKEIRKTFTKMTARCASISYCIDITNIAKPDGNNYSDVRHHNSNGNEIISNEIYNTLSIR